MLMCSKARKEEQMKGQPEKHNASGTSWWGRHKEGFITVFTFAGKIKGKILDFFRDFRLSPTRISRAHTKKLI